MPVHSVQPVERHIFDSDLSLFTVPEEIPEHEIATTTKKAEPTHFASN